MVSFSRLTRVVILGGALLSSVNGYPHIDKLARNLEKYSETRPTFGRVKGLRLPWRPSQLVDVTGAHVFQPPKSGESRGPCPALNALANHGYMNRSGWTTLDECTEANVNVYNLDRPFSQGLCFLGQYFGGNFLTPTWAIGNSSSYDPNITQDTRAEGVGSGLAQTHNNFEGDHSMFQVDWHTSDGADASDIDISYFQQLWDDVLPNGTFDDFGIFAKHHHRRLEHSVQNNPCMFNGISSGLASVPGGYAFTYRMFRNHTADHPQGTISKEVLASFFGVEIGKNGSLKKKPFGHEQIPDHWSRRPTPYTLKDFLTTDYKDLQDADSRTSIFGGNINGTNTFTGVGIDDISNGVFKSFQDGDTFPCFYYRLVQGAIKDTIVGPALAYLGSTVGEVVDLVFSAQIDGSGYAARDCPQANIKDVSLFTQYCGNRVRS